MSLKKNLYRAKQASKVWFDHLRKGLRKRGFKQSKVDGSVFFKGNTIFFCYVDDGCFIGPDSQEIDTIIKSLQEDYDMTDEGDLNEYLGIKMERMDNGGRRLIQPNLIRRILKAVNLDEERPNGRVEKKTPATRVLTKDVNGKDRKLDWDF